MGIEVIGIDSLLKDLDKIASNIKASGSWGEQPPMDSGTKLANDAISAYADAILKAREKGDKQEEENIKKEVEAKFGKDYQKKLDESIMDRFAHKMLIRIVPKD